MKDASFLRTTLHPDPSLHLLDQLPANSKAKAGSAVLSGRRAISLSERFKDHFLFIRWDADSGIVDGELHMSPNFLSGTETNFHRDFAAFGKLNRVIN